MSTSYTDFDFGKETAAAVSSLSKQNDLTPAEVQFSTIETIQENALMRDLKNDNIDSTKELDNIW